MLLVMILSLLFGGDLDKIVSPLVTHSINTGEVYLLLYCYCIHTKCNGLVLTSFVCLTYVHFIDESSFE